MSLAGVFALLYLLFFILAIVFAIRVFFGKRKGKDVKTDKVVSLSSLVLFVIFFILTGVFNPPSEKKDIDDAPEQVLSNDSASTAISVIEETIAPITAVSTEEKSSTEATNDGNDNSITESTTSSSLSDSSSVEASSTDNNIPEKKELYEDLEEIPYYDIVTNLDKYKDTTVKTTVMVEKCYDLSDSTLTDVKGKTQLYVGSVKISSLNYVGNSIYLDDVVSVSDNSYATVVCKIQLDNYGSEEFVNGVLIDSSPKAKQTYEADYDAFVQRFKEEAEAATYDTLLRYPDSYTGKRVKVKVKIKVAEPDGVIFQGDLIGTIPGTSKDISFYDSRTLREPRLQVGDVVTIYGFGDGLMTISEIEWSGIIPHTKNKYDIPSISLWFVEF